MPSTMIHILTAHEWTTQAPDLFWVGCFAPDYTNEMKLKDQIHLRDAENRWDALEKLKGQIDLSNPFESGWLLHLFTDARWDEAVIPEFHKNHMTDGWFKEYRNEIGLASYYLYHHMPWAKDIWEQIKRADISSIKTQLPISAEENNWYRDRVVGKHEESGDTPSNDFPETMLVNFAGETIRKFRLWIE